MTNKNLVSFGFFLLKNGFIQRIWLNNKAGIIYRRCQRHGRWNTCNKSACLSTPQREQFVQNHCLNSNPTASQQNMNKLPTFYSHFILNRQIIPLCPLTGFQVEVLFSPKYHQNIKYQVVTQPHFGFPPMEKSLRHKCAQPIGEIFPPPPFSLRKWRWITDNGIDYEIRWVT
jgi:hypothetical protein